MAVFAVDCVCIPSLLIHDGISFKALRSYILTLIPMTYAV